MVFAFYCSAIFFLNEVTIMLSPEMLAALGCGAVLPYFGEALWSWAKAKRGTRAVHQNPN
jgi:hypothetical protein